MQNRHVGVLFRAAALSPIWLKSDKKEAKLEETILKIEYLHCLDGVYKREVRKNMENQRTSTKYYCGERGNSGGPCTQSFVKKTNMEEHLRKHSGRKPYECEKCGKKFRQNS